LNKFDLKYANKLFPLACGEKAIDQEIKYTKEKEREREREWGEK